MVHKQYFGVERQFYRLRCPSVCLSDDYSWLSGYPQRAGVHKLIKNIGRIFKNISLRLDKKFASQAVWEKLTLCILWHTLLIPTLLSWHCSPAKKIPWLSFINKIQRKLLKIISWHEGEQEEMFYERNISVEITDINYNVNPDSSELFCVTEAAKVLIIV